MLAEPVEGRLVFAGEATSSDSPATVHGALESGLRAADQVAELAPRGATVTVIGAGTAGLACARTLIDTGFSVNVLEARDRLGGRVWTEEIDGIPAEMGASWIHGLNGNPLTEISDEAGIERIAFAYQPSFTSPGQAAAAEEGGLQLARGLRSFDWRAGGAAITPVSDLLPRRRGPGLEWAIESVITQDYGADPENLAVIATEEGEAQRGGDALLDGSYADMIVDAAGDLPVETGVNVKRVSYGPDSAEVLDDAGNEYSSEFVVVTVPIGVLKQGSIGFSPGLPPDTQRAIDGLGRGLLDKLWLAFDEPFWDPDAELISWIDPVRPGIWTEWVNGYRAFGRPVLLGFNGGGEAWRLASMDDRSVLTSAMAALSLMYGRG